MRRGQSFSSRLYLLLIVSIVIPVFTLAAVLSASYNQWISQEENLNKANMMAALGGNMQSNLSEAESIAFLPYLYRDIHNYMLNLKNGYYHDPPPYLNMASAENNYVITFSKMMFTARQSVFSIAFYPAVEGNDEFYIIRRNRAGLYADVQPGYAEEGWYLLAQEREKAFLLQQEEGAYILTLVQMIRDLDSKKNVGVLRIRMKADVLLENINGVELGKGVLLYLVDADDEVLYCAGQAQDASVQLSGEAAARFVPTESAVPAAGWRLVHLTPRASLMWMQAETYLIAFLLSLSVALVALLIYRRRSRATVASVNTILSTLREMQGGNFEARSQVGSPDELRAISQSVNQMGERISSHIEREYKAVIDRQNAEYRALQAQINPHFLYNTLNDFVALNRMGEQKKLEKAILRLTQLFRYACSTSSTASVRDEMDFCRRYLQLRQLQLEDRLRFEIEIGPSCENIQIPKLILQPLVENSVVHGLGNGKGGLWVQMRAFFADEALTLEVGDNGMGFDASLGGEGIALTNIRSRLALFSPGAVMTVNSTPGGGTRCVITIPPDWQAGERKGRVG